MESADENPIANTVMDAEKHSEPARGGVRRSWLTVAAGGAALLTACTLWLEPGPFDESRLTTRVLLWPVSGLVTLVGSGPDVGGRYEWTPVHDIAVAFDVGLSWLFWCSVFAGLRALQSTRW
jgi:hypothetical protein